MLLLITIIWAISMFYAINQNADCEYEKRLAIQNLELSAYLRKLTTID